MFPGSYAHRKYMDSRWTNERTLKIELIGGWVSQNHSLTIEKNHFLFNANKGRLKKLTLMYGNTEKEHHSTVLCLRRGVKVVGWGSLRKRREKYLRANVGWISLRQMRKRCRPAIGGSWYTSLLDFFFVRIFLLRSCSSLCLFGAVHQVKTNM